MSSKASPHLRLVDRTPSAPAVAGVAVAGEPSVTASLTRASDPHGSTDAVPRSRQARQLEALLELNDAQIVGLARSGEALAFEALYRRHISFAIHLATRIEGSARDVEDVVHDSFIKAFGRLADLADPGAFRSWLGSIVVFAVRSRLRRLRVMSLLGLGRGADPVDLDSIASQDTSPHTRAQLAQIYALLKTRPLDDRIAWTLRHVEGHELEVAAKLCGCSLATVKRRITRVQSFLEEHFVSAPSPGPSTEASASVQSPHDIPSDVPSKGKNS